MMQTQWPGSGLNIDLPSLDASSGSGRRLWAGDAAPGVPAAQTDGVARPWWTCGTPGAASGDPLAGWFGGGYGSAGGSIGSILSGLMQTLQQLVGLLAGNGGAQPCAGAQLGGPAGPLPGGPQQRFADVDVSSTGDPHIASTGTAAGPGGSRAVDDRWDSMTAHDDLVHSNQIEGGYRVATAVTQPGANGITSNQSATVYANYDQDAVSMNRDGSYAIYDDGRQVELGKGESAQLSGGETVTVNQDGSLTVGAGGPGDGTISTTLRSTGAGVDVSAHAHDLALGGDAIAHAKLHAKPPHAPQPGHRTPLRPVIDAAAATAGG